MEKLVTIKTLAELKKLQELISQHDFIALDIETTGVEKSDEIIGYSIAWDVEEAYYIVTAYWDVSQQKLTYLETKEGTKEFFESLKGKNLIMQNAMFDCSMINNNYGVELMPYVHTDTLMLGHLLNENRSNGLKERGVELYGEDARKEQQEMKESVYKNGGVLTKEKYELYKADVDLMAKYGAKDAILTLKIFYHDVEELYEQGLEDFFYKDETMPLLRGPTYDLNTVGLRVDLDKIATLRATLEAEIMEARAFIYKEIDKHIKDKYPGTSKAKTFNINAGQQLAWLLFVKLGNEFNGLTKGGRELCKALDLKMPYAFRDKRAFIEAVSSKKGEVWQEPTWNWKTKKMSKPKKVGDYWTYFSCGKESLLKLSDKYKWVKRRLELAKNTKLLSTYVDGIGKKVKYGIIHPSFLQHGTTSGRYSSRNPNFQNLPRDDKRIKACIIPRVGKVFVGADQSQLEPRVFASQSKDEKLRACFKNGDDFYSVIGTETFEKFDCTLKKADKEGFAIKYPKLRDSAKVVGLSATYGTTAFKMAPVIGKSVDDTQEVIDAYFRKFPDVKKFQLETHEFVKTNGYVTNLFGRPRRMPKALEIRKIYGNTKHEDLPYAVRNILNLSVNHKIQSTSASIMNRVAIAFRLAVEEKAKLYDSWAEVKVILQVHDSLVAESPESIAKGVAALMKHCMENTVKIPGVDLEAEPKIGNSLEEV